MIRRSGVAVAILMCFLMGSCTRSGEVEPVASGGKYGSGVDLEAVDEKDGKEGRDRKGGAKTSGGANSASSGAPRGASAGQGGGGPAVPPPESEPGTAEDGGDLGQNALAYLRGAHSKLVIEITAVEGKEPTQSALDTLRARLSEVLTKPQGIEFVKKKPISPSKTSYSTEEAAEIERRHRTQYSDAKGPKVVMHLLYLNGTRRDDPRATGTAYGASSAVMFPDRFAEASNPVVTAEKIGVATLVHEAGHLLGLVNIGYKSPRPHEDPEHENHSNNKNSVMYWAIDTIGVASVLSGEIPTTFDAADKADLADRKSGRL